MDDSKPVIVEYDDIEMKRLIGFWLEEKTVKFLAYQGKKTIARGNGRGDIVQIGKKNPNIEVIELAQYYNKDGFLCVRSILRMQRNKNTNVCTAKCRGKKILQTKNCEWGINGINDKFPDRLYYSLLQR